MGNYKNINIEFVERTLHLISQYESIKHKYDFPEQYNHTLLINCLLGLVVFPNEKVFGYAPAERITTKIKSDMGVNQSTFNEDIKDLKTLILRLRNAVAHFAIEFESNDENFLIDRIIFYDHKHQEGYKVATFVPDELLNFTRYYGGWLISNLNRYEIKIETEKWRSSI